MDVLMQSSLVDLLLKPPLIVVSIAILVVLDLLFRWVAYARYDSIVVDVCIFSAFLILIEFVHGESYPERAGTFVSLILEIFLILTAIVFHRHLDNKVKHEVERLFDDVPSSHNPKLIAAVRRLGEAVITVDLLQTKLEKHRDRNAYLELLRHLGIVKENITASRFLLPKARFWALLFLFIGIIAIIIPAMIPCAVEINLTSKSSVDYLRCVLGEGLAPRWYIILIISIAIIIILTISIFVWAGYDMPSRPIGNIWRKRRKIEEQAKTEKNMDL